MNLRNLCLSAFTTIFIISCASKGSDRNIENGNSVYEDSAAEVVTPAPEPEKIANTAEAILAKPQVPVLCYHHIRENKPGQSETFKTYSVSPSQFADQMKALHDSGYNTILPQQLYDYLVYNAELPAKSIMLTFDDSIEGQYSIAAKEMDKYGFKGVFFLMTISLDRPNYMTKEQVQDLVSRGHAIESHTWDHHRVDKYAGDDFQKQFAGSNKTIEEITGKPVAHFAYPFGIWSKDAFDEMKTAGYKLAFILSTKRDSTEPLLTVRRMIVPSQWSTKGMISAMKKTFE